MPDRVVVPNSVPKPYRQVFIQTLENPDPESIGDCFLRDAELDITRHGRVGDELIRQVIQRLELLTGNSFLPMLANWHEERAYIEELILGTAGNRLHIECAATAVRLVLHRLANGEHIPNREVLGSVDISTKPD